MFGVVVTPSLSDFTLSIDVCKVNVCCRIQVGNLERQINRVMQHSVDVWRSIPYGYSIDRLFSDGSLFMTVFLITTAFQKQLTSKIFLMKNHPR